MVTPVISSFFPRSVTMTRRPPARASRGMASAIARVAMRPPSQPRMTRSSLSPCFWISGTTIRGRPDFNSAPSIINSSAAPRSGLAWPTTEVSKRRAIWPNVVAAPARLASSMRAAADTSFVPAAPSKRSTAAFAAFTSPCAGISIRSVGMPPITVSGITGSRPTPSHGDVRAESLGDRARVFGREVLRRRARKIDDDVLEHGPTSSAAPSFLFKADPSARALTSWCRPP